MADPDLTESAWQRALSAARRVYPSTEFEVAAALMTIIAGAIAAVASADKGTTIQIAIPVLGGAVALLMTFAVVLAFQLVAAPIRQRNELRAAWSRPEPEPAQPVNVGVALSDLRRRGKDLINGFSFRGGYNAEDEEAVESWTRETVQFLSERCDPASAKQFIDASRGEEHFVPSVEARVRALDLIIVGLG